jgi:IMP dehydrogenase
MTTVRDLHIPPIWVNPQHLAATAGYVLGGHKMKVCGVIDCDQLVGVVTTETLSGASGTVRDVMGPAPAVVDGADSVRKVAERFAEDGLEYAAVVDNDHFIGMITPTMLLRELGKSYDPMTDLSWSDELRRWGISHLERGEEVTILFIDLNDFGHYNKIHGHIVGDQVLSAVSSYLKGYIEPEHDILVRYGGDEFAIGTVRTRQEADQLAQKLTAGMSELKIGEEIEPITFSVGVFGGMRQKERLSVHYAATVDNLINMASKACQAQKSAAKGVDAPIPAAALKTEGYRVVGVFADGGDGGITTVILSRQGTVFSGASNDPGIRGVVNAAARALENSKPGLMINLDTVSLEEGNFNLKGTVTEDGGERPIELLNAELAGDANDTAVKALIAIIG